MSAQPVSSRSRLRPLLAALAAVGAFIAWDANRDPAGALEVAEAVPREQRAESKPRDTALKPTVRERGEPLPDPSLHPLPEGPRGAAAPSAVVALDLFRPARAMLPAAPAPSERPAPDEARVVGTAQEQGRWVALVEQAGETHWLAPGQRAGNLRVDRVTARGVQVTDLSRGSTEHLNLDPADHVAGLHAHPHED